MPLNIENVDSQFFLLSECSQLDNKNDIEIFHKYEPSEPQPMNER